MRFNFVATLALAVPMVAAYSLQHEGGPVEVGERPSIDSKPMSYKGEPLMMALTSRQGMQRRVDQPDQARRYHLPGQ
jgi:hypothetical protein